eukprot:403354659
MLGNNTQNQSNINKSHQQQNQPVRYPPQMFKYQKPGGADPAQFQLHYQIPLSQQAQQQLNMPLYHSQQQYQQQQYINSSAPEYQVNNMMSKLSVNDIQLSQQSIKNHLSGVSVSKPSSISRKLLFKSNTPVNTNQTPQANDMIISNPNNAPSSSNILQSTDIKQHINQVEGLTISQQVSSSPYQNMQPQHDSVFTRSYDNFDITSSRNMMNPASYNQQQQTLLSQQQLLSYQQQQTQQQPVYQFNAQQQQQQQQQQKLQYQVQQQILSQTGQYGQQTTRTSIQNLDKNTMKNQRDFNLSQRNNARTGNAGQLEQLSGSQSNRPSSEISFSQNQTQQLTSLDSSIKRQQTVQPARGKSNDGKGESKNEIIISNIDRETVGHIIHEIHSHGVQEIDYKLIEQKQIFIVKFINKESIDWAIEKYDGQVVNGMKLQVRQVTERKNFRLRNHQILPLSKINETNAERDEDVGSDGSNLSNLEGNKSLGSGSGSGGATSQMTQNQAPPGSVNHPTPDLNQIKMSSIAQQRATTPKISSDKINKGTARGDLQYGYQTTSKFPANNHYQNHSVSPNQSFQQPHSSNAPMMQSITARQGYIASSAEEQYHNQISQAVLFNMQNQQQLIYNGNQSLVGSSNQNMFDQYGNALNMQALHQSFYQQPMANLSMNKQVSQGQMSFQQHPQQNQSMNNFSQSYHQSPHQDLKRSNSGILKIHNKLAHTLNNKKQLEIINQNMNLSMQINADQQQQQRSDQLTKSLSFQLNTQKFKSDDFDEKDSYDEQTIDDKYSQAFGYNSSGSGLLIQQQPSYQQQQQNLQQSFHENIPSFGKISESIDGSQNDEINLHQINNEVSIGSERESFYNKTTKNAINTQTVKNISTRSDSDHSHQITHQIMVQQYQSPESTQKLTMTQRNYNLNNSLDYMLMSNSGRDSPQKFSTPGSKLNNSFHHFGSSQNLSNYIRINNEIQNSQQQHQGNTGPYHHARNFSAEQQFYQSEAMQYQHYMPQPLNQSNLNHSISMQSMQQFPNQYYNYLSTSQDLNNISLYGHPVSMQNTLNMSASNSSVDLATNRISIQNRSRIQGGNQNHQQLRSAYKDSVEPQNEENFIIDDCKIKGGEDKRTTIMIRNIPNKYKQKNLLDEINQNNKGKYDFVYLPIDFSNNANIGYAFVNFVNPLFILEFKEEFENRRWRKFQSQKKCELKYGRLQGIAQINQHFQNSTVSNQVDVQVRPRMFDENSRKDWTKEIHRLCNKYTLNPQFFLGFKNNNNQQSLSMKHEFVSSISVNSQQNISMPRLDKSRSVDTTSSHANYQQNLNTTQISQIQDIPEEEKE